MNKIRSSAPHIKDIKKYSDLTDWGNIPTMLEGESHTSGKTINKNKKNECGMWICTPGKWECHVTKDEFCYFIEGQCTYVHQNGEVIEIKPDTAAFFPKNWKGICTVHKTIKKVYMISGGTNE